MSAGILREAAALMRERAEAARPDHPWYDRGDIAEGMAAFTDTGDEPVKDAEHIASWHPAVALAVADWLDAVAEVHWPKRHDVYSESHYNAEPEHDYFNGLCDESCWRESYICNGCGTAECKPEISGPALAVARAYLGRDE